MKKLLWIGDAVVATGFARATHYILDVLKETWDVHVLGINYQGDPHKYPYPIYPCWPGKDLFGLGRTAALVTHLRPDVVFIQNDPWNVPEYVKRAGNAPTVAMIAVDGKNCAGVGLNGLAHAIFWTEFGAKEARLGGYHGPSDVVPLGVDRTIYKPLDRLAARKTLGLPPSAHHAFIVGNVNRNQPRKRLDLCLMYFAKWIRHYNIDDAYFFFHAAPTGDLGYNLTQLAQYLGVSNRLIIAEPEIGFGVDESRVNVTYNAFDIMMTTTQGEGFGLTTLEGMACGIPQIVPDWSALGEICDAGAIKVPCTSFACTPNTINVIGGIADEVQTIVALDKLYRDKELRNRLSQEAIELASRDIYDWRNIGEAVRDVLEEALLLKVA